MEDTFMIHYRAGRWVNVVEELLKPTAKPVISRAVLEESAQGYERPLTVDDFLELVVARSEYQPADVVAVGIASTHFIQGEKLHAAYLTPRGMVEATEPGDLRKPYAHLEDALSGPMHTKELDAGDLPNIVQMIGPDTERTLIDWGGPDGKKRVVAVYAKDVSARTF